MDPAAFSRLREIVLSAASAPPEDRDAVLARECADDSALLATARLMLRFDPGGSALDQPRDRSGDVGPLTAAIAELDGTPTPQEVAEALADAGLPFPQGLPPEGTAIPGYRVIRKLGEGGMGAVYLGEDVKLGRPVALKFLRPDLVEPGMLTRFVHEARAAAAIDHPNICPVYGIHEADGRTFIAMAYIGGETLRHRIHSGPLTVDETLGIGTQIARGLAVTHAKGIIHRDLKPSNVMLSADGSVRIVDFGIAQSGDRPDMGGAGARMGTIAYMSPERFQGEHVGHEADVWALGVVLFEMLAGRLPLEGGSDHTLRHNVVHNPPLRIADVRDDVPPALGALIDRCLARKPADRPSAAEALDSLEALRLPPDRRLAGVWKLATVGFAAVAVLTVLGWWQGWFGNIETPTGGRLTRLTLFPEEVGGALLPGSISPDGRRLALPLRHLAGDWAALGVLSIETGQTRQITVPAGEVYSVGWMPDGETLLTFEYHGNLPWRKRRQSPDSRAQIWLRNIVRDTSRVLYEHPRYTTLLWPVVSPDGTMIAMFRGNRRRVWVMSASGGDPRKILEVPAGEVIRSLVWSPSGTRVAYVRSHPGAQGSAASIETCDLEGATTVVLERDVDLDPGREDVTLCWLPDGRLLFVRYTDLLRMTAGLWSVPVDPATGVRDGAPEPFLELDEAAIGQPTASADGRRLAFYAWKANMRPRLLEIDASGDSVGMGRWMSQNWPAHPGAWSRQGHELYFSAVMSAAGCDIYVENTTTGLAEPVVATPEQEYVACLTGSGEDLLFWQGDRLKRMPAGGGEAVEVFRSPTPIVSWRDAQERVMCSAGPESRCVLKRVEGDSTAFYAFDPVDGTVLDEVARVGFRLMPPQGRCDLSPDGRRIAIVANDALWMLEVDQGSLRRIERDWAGSPLSVSWSGDAAWLCVVGQGGEASNWVRRVDLDGGSRLIWSNEETAVLPLARPAPDGSRVALVVLRGETDAWMLEDF